VVRFLTHALVDYGVARDQLADELSEQLDYPTAPPAPVQYRAQLALREHFPINEAETVLLERAEQDVRGVLDFADKPDLDVQAAFHTRGVEYKLSAAVHAVEMLLLDDFPRSQTARDNSGDFNVFGSIVTGHIWGEAEKRAIEVMQAVE
jgi:hypothetical protein